MTVEPLLALTARIVAAHLQGSRVPAAELPALMRTVHAALTELGTPTPPSPAIGIEQSLASPEHIVSMIDGRGYKSLKRHLARNGYTPETYRAAFGLPADYPLIAPAYSESRRRLAAQTGLGRQRRKRASA